MLRLLFALFVVLFVFEVPAFALTCPQTINSQVTAADSKQTGRLNRGAPATTCAAPTPVPAIVNAGSSFAYEAHTFKNRTNGTCMTATLTSSDDLSAAAYLGSFVPTNVQQNYLGDSGDRASAGNPKTFSFTVPALADFIVVVSEGVVGAVGNYQLSVTGCGEVLVSSVTPSFGTTAGGTNVTIKGAGFLSAPAVPTVRFGGPGGTQATNVVVLDEFTLTATTPAHAAGAVDVYVKNQNNAAGQLANGFTYYTPVASTVTLASSKNPSRYGEAVTYTAHVDPQTPIPPTGNVSFSNGAVIFATVALDANGDAKYTTGALPAATHPIVAQYAGDGVHLAATSNTINQVVQKTDTDVVLVSSSNPSLLGQAVTFTATPNPVAPGQGTPTGNVIFREEGAAALGTVALDLSGQAKLTITTFTSGTHVIRAEYVGDGNFNADTSADLSQVVNQTGTTLALVSSQNPSIPGANVTFTATVTTNAGGGTPTGTVSFTDNGASMGAGVTLDAQGKAAISSATLTTGTHTITAAYSGDGAHAPANGSVSQVVDAAATATSLASSQNPSTVNTSVTFTATVTSAVQGTITGNVVFKNGTTVLGNGALSAGGVATFAIANLPVGTHPIVAVYEGTPSYKTSTSAVVNQSVKDASTSDAGAPDAGKPDAGGTVDAGTNPGVDASGIDASLPQVIPNIEGGGCDCRSSTSPDAGFGGVATLLGAILVLARRRRKK